MAPMVREPQPRLSSAISECSVACSDPSVLPSAKASSRIKQLWWLHGHPHSKRYSDPALVSLGALVRHDGVVYKGQTGFLYPLTSDAQTPYGSMTWDEFDTVTENVAAAYADELRAILQDANSSRKQPTVGLLGGGRSLQYFCTQLALQKLGIRVLLLAESNAAVALHHLLDCCNASAVITDSKNANANTKGVPKVAMIEDLPRHRKTKVTEVEAVKFQNFEDVWERHSFIIHSSGSTGLPKPIIHTNRSMMLIARMYRLFQEFEAKNWFLLFPLYHIAGISIGLSGLPNGQILSFPPLSWPPSSSGLLSALSTLEKMSCPADIIHCAPTLIENMYEYIVDNGRDFTSLASLKVLQPGGAALSDRIINGLVANNVNVKTTYGTTETGPFMRPIPHTMANPSCYSFRNLYPDSDKIRMEEIGDNVYECIIYKGFELAAELWEGKPDDEPYRTNDLFSQDPPGSGFFVLHGRKDDILIHTNGENTSAGSLQLDIETSSRAIKKVLALGHSRPCVGLLVETNDGFDPAAESTEEEIWRAVKAVNERYPGHSRVIKSMLYILPRAKSLPVTPKFNVKRKEAMQVYEKEIAQLYDDVGEQSTGTKITSDMKETIRALFADIAEVQESDVKGFSTLYELGVDSGSALSLRASLSKQIGPISLGTIFENPSVDKLLAYYQKRNQTAAVESRSSVIERMISRLSLEISSWPTRSSHQTFPTSETETVLLTGSTGSLGTALLETLSASPRVSKIYAMVRGPNHESRLRKSIASRGLSVEEIMGSNKIEVINYCMQDALLGLDIFEYSKLAQEVTIVIQNAWKMNFNQGVEFFENDCIRNTMSLLRLCHAGRPKTFAFTSSVSACMGAAAQAMISEEPISQNPLVALNTGYAHSKYIMERVTQFATKQLSIPIRILRVGQLCGNTRTGFWNTDEMWPIMFATSAKLQAVPLIPEQMVDWTPVDVAGRTVCDILLNSKTHASAGIVEKTLPYTVHNLVNPHSIPWSAFIPMLQASGISSSSSSPPMQEVPFSDWVRRLNAAVDGGASPEQLPGLRLLQFFENMAAESSTQTKVFDTSMTRRISPALRECEAFCLEWLGLNLDVWRERGFV